MGVALRACRDWIPGDEDTLKPEAMALGEVIVKVRWTAGRRSYEVLVGARHVGRVTIRQARILNGLPGPNLSLLCRPASCSYRPTRV